MPQLSISLLGPLHIGLDGKEAARFQSNKVRALLAFLATEPGDHHRQALAALLWPDYPNPSALAYLRNALANLRQVIGDAESSVPFLEITRDAVRMRSSPQLQVDLIAFELAGKTQGDPASLILALPPGLDLVRGPFLDGFTCDSTTFEEWALTCREQVSRTQREMLARLAEAYAQIKDHPASIRAARRLLELDPWDEQAHRLVMQGLAQNGQRGAALAQFETCKRILREELDVEPDPLTRAAVEEIRAGFAIPEGMIDHTDLAARPRLPNPLTSFIGRQPELAEIRSLLAEPSTRLLTLTGTGGCGKTRLAIATAAAAVFPHGAWWADLAAISDPDQVPAAVAAALGLTESPSTPPRQLLINYLRGRDLLLVLDNCEQLSEACSRLVETLLHACPGIKILATSREPLGAQGEVLWRVPSLSLPRPNDSAPRTVAELRSYDALRLFEERARSASPGWALDGNAPLALAICTQLEGIPLAIELAAARVRMLSVEQIAARLGSAFQLLTGGARTALPRHQTLRACIDWSYHLLDPSEQTLLRRLSVFNDGWSLEEAEAMITGLPIQEVAPGDGMDLLGRLADKSLVVVDLGNHQASRFRLLETVRQFAAEKLAAAGEEQPARQAHLACFVNLVNQAEPELRGPDQVAWLDRLETELGNLRAAMEWSLLADPPSGLRIAGALLWFWRIRDHLAEAYQWLDRCLTADAAAPRPAAANRLLYRGWALNAFIWILRALSSGAYYWKTTIDLPEKPAGEIKINACLAEARDIFSTLGKPGRRGLAFLYRQQGMLASVQYGQQGMLGSDPVQAQALLEKSLAIFREEGDKFYTVECLWVIGGYLQQAHDFLGAQKVWYECLYLSQVIGDIEGLAYGNHNLGQLALFQAQFALAEDYFQKALTLFNQIKHTSYFCALLGYLAVTAIEQGDAGRALEYCEKALAIFQGSGDAFFLVVIRSIKARAIASRDPAEAKRILDQTLRVYIVRPSHPDLDIVINEQACLAAIRSQPARAARLLGWSLINYQPLCSSEFQRIDKLQDSLRNDLGNQAFERAFQDGKAMTREQVIACALEED